MQLTVDASVRSAQVVTEQPHYNSLVSWWCEAEITLVIIKRAIQVLTGDSVTLIALLTELYLN